MAKPKRRSPHGSVNILTVKNNLHLRWTYQGARHRMSMKSVNNPVNYQAAKAKAAQIEQDMAREEFDTTLEKYKPKPIALIEMPKSQSTIALWEVWMNKQRDDGVATQTIAGRYAAIHKLLSLFKRNIETPQDATDFQNFLMTRQSPGTVNRNIKMLRSFFNWCVKQSTMTTNPVADLRLIKDSGTQSHKRVPFSLDEIDRILSNFRLHPLHFRYHDFALMLFTFGLRPSECIGLQWKDIDLTRGTITIAQSLSRSGDGSKRVRKERKNNSVTVIDLPQHIHTMLQGRFTAQTSPSELIFTGLKGKTIDDHTFSQRIWRSVLKQAGITHRPPYNCRHSMASHAIDQGVTLPETAYLLGHKDTSMVSKVYGHMVNRPQVPKLGL